MSVDWAARFANEQVFVDTNILIYAYDRNAGEKASVAEQCLRALWESHNGMLSLQVLVEFLANSVRKLPGGLAWAREVVRTYESWLSAPNTIQTVYRASEIMASAQLSLWDSHILAAAEGAGATILLTEDLNHGQLIAGIRIENPFLTA